MDTKDAGRMGGLSRSDKKIGAARLNGALGGWPKGRPRKNNHAPKE